MNDAPLGALTGALVIILVFSAFFAAAETAMMALNRYRLRHFARKGHRGARLTAGLLARIDRLLGVLLLGNNLLNAAAATLATVISVRLFGNGHFTLTIATLGVSFLIVVFSELTPKVVGAAHPERIAFASAYVLTPLLRLLWPIVWFVNLFVTGLLKLMRVRAGGAEAGHNLTLDELRTLVQEGGPVLPQKHRSILLNLFELEKTTVDDVMMPRSQIEALDLRAAPEQLRAQLSTCHHTRLPVYEDQIDNVVGILHVRHVLHLMREDDFTADLLRQALRQPYFIPEGTPLLTQLQNFQENHRRIALIVDEYGELRGLVTLEDILEEIVGEYTTQAPAQGLSCRPLDGGGWLVDGASQLRDLNRKLGLALPLDGPRTLNGLILERFEDIPEAGVSLQIDGHTVEIVQTQGRQVKMVRLYGPPQEAE